MNDKILVIDGYADKAKLVVPLYIKGQHEIVTAKDAEQALKQLLAEDFFAVILFVRGLMPGEDDLFKECYYHSADLNHQLGWALLYLLFRPELFEQRFGKVLPLTYVERFAGQKNRFIVLSDETNTTIQEFSADLGISVIEDNGHLPASILRDRVKALS